MCSPTHHVCFWRHFRSRPQAPPSGYNYHYNNLDMRTFCEQILQLFLHHNTILVDSSVGIVGYLFPKCWNWQICHTHQAIKLPLRTLSGKLRTFPTVKSKTIGFTPPFKLTQVESHGPVAVLYSWSNTAVHFRKSARELLLEKEQLSGHYAAYFEVDGTCYTTRCTSLVPRPVRKIGWGLGTRLTVHVTSLCALWKSLEALGRTTSSVTDTRLPSRFSQKR